MTRDAPSPDHEQLYTLVRQYDEAIAHGADGAPPPESISSLKRDEAEEFQRLRQCVAMLEQMRRDRVSRSPSRMLAAGGGAARRYELPSHIGRFELLGEIGRGGCGVVFRAHDPQLGRDVALKVPRPEALVSDDMRERFLREARTAASMDHANLVPVYEVGEDGPICYIAAAFINGPSLAVWLQGRHEAVDAREAATLVATLADALEQAHAHGVIHRDIKPGNVLLQPLEQDVRSARLSGYVPKLTDFGLAKLRESDDAGTRTGVVIGTPDYMAPEQAQGRLSEIGPATDVYALGAILYELLAGQPPLRGESEVDTLRRIVADEPPLVRLARPRVGRDVEAICMKCLEKRPAQRYQRAAELAADLRRYLSGQATHARPIGTPRRLVRWSRRRPALAALLLVSVVSAAALGVGSLVYNARLADALSVAQAERNRAEGESLTSRKLLYAADMRLADDAWRSLNRTRTLELLERHIPASSQPDLREFSWYWLWSQCHAEVLTLTGHSDEVFCVAFSPDGKLLASAGKDGTVRIWDPSTGRPRHVLRDHTDEVTCLAFSPDGSRLASGGEDRQVIVWNPHHGEKLFSLAGHEDHILAVTFSPDGSQLASGGRDACVRLWNLETNEPQRVLTEPKNVVRCVRYSPDGKVLAACDEAGAIHRWDIETWRPSEQLSASEGPLFAIDFQSDARRLIAAGRDATLCYWELELGQHLEYSAFENHVSWIRAARISPNGRVAATCNHYGFVRLWNLDASPDESDALLTAIPGHDGRIWGLDWSPDGKFVATAGADRTVKLWNIEDRLRPTPYERPPGWVWNVAFTADSSGLVAAVEGGAVCRWDLDTYGITHRHSKLNNGKRCSLAITREGTFAATAAENGTDVCFLDLASGSYRFHSGQNNGGVNDLDLSADGRLLAVGSNDGTARVFELPAASQKQLFRHPRFVNDATFSPDGKTVATCSDELRLWDVESGAMIWGRRYHDASSRYAIFTPDGKQIVVAVGGDKTAVVDATNGQLVALMVCDQADAWCLAISPDGRTLAIGVNSPSRVLLWDLQTFQQLCTLDAAGMKAIFTLAFSPDGRRLVAGGQSAVPHLAPHGSGRIVEWMLESEQALTVR